VSHDIPNNDERTLVLSTHARVLVSVRRNTAVRIDQTHATNTAFRTSIQPALTVPEIVSTEELLPPQGIVEELLTTPRPQPQSPVVFGSPVSKPEKDRDWTGPRPIRTTNSQDRKRLKTAVRSSVLHNLGN